MTDNNKMIADTIRTAPLSNKAREELAHHFAEKLASLMADFDRMKFIQRCMGWAPEINTV